MGGVKFFERRTVGGVGKVTKKSDVAVNKKGQKKKTKNPRLTEGTDNSQDWPRKKAIHCLPRTVVEQIWC